MSFLEARRTKAGVGAGTVRRNRPAGPRTRALTEWPVSVLPCAVDPIARARIGHFHQASSEDRKGVATAEHLGPRLFEPQPALPPVQAEWSLAH